MPDVDHWWGNPLSLTASGDLAIVDGTTLGEQRIVRRLMTAADRRDSEGVPQQGEYNAHPSYGGSLPQRIGDNIDEPLLASVVRGQIVKEPVVARLPPPVIELTSGLDTVAISIAYQDAASGQQKFLSFDASK